MTVSGSDPVVDEGGVPCVRREEVKLLVEQQMGTREQKRPVGRRRQRTVVVGWREGGRDEGGGQDDEDEREPNRFTYATQDTRGEASSKQGKAGEGGRVGVGSDGSANSWKGRTGAG